MGLERDWIRLETKWLQSVVWESHLESSSLKKLEQEKVKAEYLAWLFRSDFWQTEGHLGEENAIK